MEPNQESMKQIVEGNKAFFDAMRRPWSTT
jgi:hypothetical protein